MRLIDVDNISFKEINKALKDLSWWCDTNEQDGVVYIPSSNLIKDIGRIKDYLEYIKEQPTAFDVEKIEKELRSLKQYDNKYDSYYDNSMYMMTDFQNETVNRTIDKALEIVKRGEV